MRDPHDEFDSPAGHYDYEEGSLVSALVKKVAPLLLVCGTAAVVVSALQDSAPPDPVTKGSGQAQMAEAMVSVGNDSPSNQTATAELRIEANSLGHFLVDSEVNGQPVRFLVDTGATKVALAAEDARRLGLSLDQLRYTEVYKTANGEVHAAPVTLRQIRIGQFVLRDVEAIVTNSPMNVSLLGMSYLGRLQSYEVRDNKMVMAW